MKRKITVITGSRAEYGMLRSVLREITCNEHLKLYLIVSGMHLSKKNGLTINEIKKDGFKIHSIVDMLPKGNSPYDMANSLGLGVQKFSEIFRKIKPDINVILGDRDEVLASALAASHMNIPNAHIHGGDRSRAGIDEYNRHAITKISNIHFAATKNSKDRIIKMGENSKFVYFTGSPAIDEVTHHEITKKEILEKQFKINFFDDEIILLYHPITNDIQQTKKEITAILNAIVKIKKPTIIIAPNSDAGSLFVLQNIQKYVKKFSFIKLFKNIPRQDFLGLLTYSGALVGNSSSGMIEASYFDILVVNVGYRQKDREHGKNVIDIRTVTTNSVYHGIVKALKMKKNYNIKSDNLYGNGNASKKIAKILEKITLNKELIKKQISY